MIVDLVGTVSGERAPLDWAQRHGRWVSETFLYSEGGRRARRAIRYRIVEDWVLHPDVAGERRDSPNYPTLLTLWEFENSEAFQRWNRDASVYLADPATGQTNLRAQYEALSPVLQREPRQVHPGSGFINLVGTFVEDPADPAQVEAWRRIYGEYMTHWVFARYPQIKRLCRFIRWPAQVDGRTDEAGELIPTMLSYYEFDTWPDFLAYHHRHHEQPDSEAAKTARKEWAERMAGIPTPPLHPTLFRVQYKAIETLGRSAA